MLQERYAPPEQASAPQIHVIDLPTAPSTDADDALPALPLPALPTSYRVAKRALDILVSALVLVVLSPVLLATALLIVLTSRGPAFFRQQRVGEGGRIFTMYKFRSMYVNADHSLHRATYANFVAGKGGNGKVTRESLRLAGLATATDDDDTDEEDFYAERRRGIIRRQLHRLRPLLHADDPRITPMGALIRVTSVDELPQLLNVLLGDMSLVGPRPPIPYEVRMYRRKHLLRLAIQPGVTGIWQVRGRNKVPFEQMVDMDIAYIKSRTFWLDLKLLILTIPAVLNKRTEK
ncbi:MAG TPA: sugar transferase [Ktedonobacterales bacterium]|nr:sugar transferase [Ktedonobacterales bacterium]